MRILSIETSCDETGISIIDASVSDDTYTFKVCADNLLSQAELHAEYGGVFPSLAKREHARTILPLLKKTLEEAGLGQKEAVDSSKLEAAQVFLEREEDVRGGLEAFLSYDVSSLDAIAVTVGPGLAPALWVGVNTARALGVLWDKPLIPVNHMHGHIFSALFKSSTMYELPALALLVSGGHTELLSLNKNLDMEFLGGTRDDAIGEAFDKAARVLDLGYPGGPLISKQAAIARDDGIKTTTNLPRPMITDSSFDVSYSGLKTALLYHVRDNPIQNETDMQALAREFEDAALDVISAKVALALKTGSFKSLVVGGGVIANSELRRRLFLLGEEHSIPLHLPEKALTTDNSLMIAVAGFVALKNNKSEERNAHDITANANLSSVSYI